MWSTKMRLFEREEVDALGGFVEIDDVGVAALGLSSRLSGGFSLDTDRAAGLMSPALRAYRLFRPIPRGHAVEQA
jgi:hypothetical protein